MGGTDIGSTLLHRLWRSDEQGSRSPLFARHVIRLEARGRRTRGRAVESGRDHVPTRSPMRPQHTALRLLVLLLALLAVMSVRQPDKLQSPQFWAEDGPVFYLDAEYLGTASIIRPYNGYWHLYPRTIALVGTKVPVRYLPTLYVAAAIPPQSAHCWRWSRRDCRTAASPWLAWWPRYCWCRSPASCGSH